MPGSVFGPYRLEARLGGGSFGEVWRATEVATGRTVALKVLSGEVSASEGAQLRADVELLAAAAAAGSAHVVRVLGGGLEPMPHVVMEYLDGTDLGAELARRGTLSQAGVLRIGEAVADALDALVRVGIVHRDVKPANIMLGRDGTVKLTDFGIAKIAGFESRTVPGHLPLTLGYAAPEVWEGEAGTPSDIYALGVVLFQCLAGRLPFTGGYAEVYRGHLTGIPDLRLLPPDTVPALRNLISACLAKASGDRPPDPAAVTAALAVARAELADRTLAEPTHPPAAFGPWQLLTPHPARPFAWRARHGETGERATLEVFFAPDAGLATLLGRALTANPALVPLGAERLIASNRLILRPGEAFATEPPDGPFAFWVAREDLPVPPAVPLHEPELRQAVDAIRVLRAAADAAGITIDMGPGALVVLPDGTVYLRRPGLPPGPTQPPDRAILATLRSLPLTRDLMAIVASAPDLATLSERLDRAPDPAAASTIGPEPTVTLHSTELLGQTAIAEAETQPAMTEQAVTVARGTLEPTPRRAPHRRPSLVALLVGVIVLGGSGLLLASGLLSGQRGAPSALAGPTASATGTTPGFAGPTAGATGTTPGSIGPTARVATYRVGAGPAGVVSDRTSIWVANRSSNTVTKLDAATGAVVGTYTVGACPLGIAFDGTSIWVANTNSNTVTKLVAATGAIVGTYDVGAAPTEMAFDGKNVWVANSGPNTVTKLDAATGAIVGTYNVGSPVGIAFDGTSIWVTNQDSGTVTRLWAGP
ncbi:MAG: serine/threonine-protein kinase [Candidatus Limnocylindrales bacterium]